METDNFIMLPTVDFCFAELMKNDKVRKGFIAALLGVSPEEVEDTCRWDQDEYGNAGQIL